MCGRAFEGWLHDKAWAGTKDVAIYLFGTPTDPHNLQAKSIPPLPELSSEYSSCIRGRRPAICPRRSKMSGLIMSHRKHIDAFAKRGQGEGCTTCHSGVVHDQPIKGYPIVMPRGHLSADSKPWHPTIRKARTYGQRALTDCFRCHDGKTEHEGKVVSRKCETCHLPEKSATRCCF